MDKIAEELHVNRNLGSGAERRDMGKGREGGRAGIREGDTRGEGKTWCETRKELKKKQKAGSE